ncbi:flagellar filament capping protein FliD [Herbaspirillum autotrophicum]|uniref:flagellar filament capping protein FliD n=1 Tax=Herbaspirillum autotrophicum TaxID=180195 RepID=UPI00067D642D|nr:flagellar filament capping protein FliD [Herbaspirillum autotrophicum]
MASGTISSPGAGNTGLDVAGIVAKLMQAENTKLDPLTKQATSYNTLLSAYGNLKSALSTYQSAIKGLTSATFSAQKSTVNNTGTAPTGSTLTTDAFTADVNTDDATKIKSQKLQSKGFPSSAVFNAGDSMAIKIGTNQPVFITLGGDATLTGLRDTINNSKAGVSASIVTDDQGSHLVFESQTGGTANTIKITSNNSLSDFAYGGASDTTTSVKQIQAAQDQTAAASGNYDISISQLASAQKLKSPGYDAGATFDTGILAIKTGANSTAIIKPASNTLAGIRDAINASTDAGVTATIVNDGSKSHLVLTAKDSGAVNSVKITGTESFAGLSFDPSATITSPGITPGQAFASGALTLNVGGSDITINPGVTPPATQPALADIMAAINTAGNGAVTASITNDGTNDHLVLKPTGSNSVSLNGSGDYTALTGNQMGQLSAAQDAKLTIDGVAVTSKSNKVTDAISGVTLNLSKVTTANDKMSLNIANDNTGVQTTATSFVTAYNTLVKTINGMMTYTPAANLGDAGTSGPLYGETSVSSLIGQMRQALIQSVPGGGSIQTLSDIGISFQKDGTLASDATKLLKATTDNFAGIQNLFTSTNGIVTKLNTFMTGVLADDGMIATKTNGIKTSLKINTDRTTAMQARLNSLQDSYTTQFNNLNLTLANMNSTQSYLTQQLAALAKSTG